MDKHVQGDLTDKVAEEIRALLARRRMSGRQLAAALNVSPSWVSYRLTGTQEIGLNDAQRIADALGVRIGDLLPREAVRSTADLDARDTRPNERSAPHPVDVRPSVAVRRRPKFRQTSVGDLIAAGATGPAR